MYEGVIFPRHTPLEWADLISVVTGYVEWLVNMIVLCPILLPFWLEMTNISVVEPYFRRW